MNKECKVTSDEFINALLEKRKSSHHSGIRYIGNLAKSGWLREAGPSAPGLYSMSDDNKSIKEPWVKSLILHWTKRRTLLLDLRKLPETRAL
ncbi:hypothetical protein RRG08_044244 [Elysia crispata]|uniref:Uncharacterized protein n=1 Tax=Elysia crispata TaxID=231223 RepID=A0AAE0XWQ4_9GAST|nr:hypothetical protein RRG08_044244 [Elysia crispata]